MRYQHTELFQKEEYNYPDDEEITKNSILINLKNLTEGFTLTELEGFILKAIGDSKNYRIFNMPDGLIVEISAQHKPKNENEL